MLWRAVVALLRLVGWAPRWADRAVEGKWRRQAQLAERARAVAQDDVAKIAARNQRVLIDEGVRQDRSRISRRRR